MTAAGRIDDQRTGRMRAPDIDLRAVENEDVFIALVVVQGNGRSWRVLQKRRRRPAIAFSIEAVDIHAGPVRRPFEIRTENST